MREIRPITSLDAQVAAPGSKSITNRGLVIGALAEGVTALEGALRCEDTERMAVCLGKLGFPVDSTGRDRFEVEGAGGRLPSPRADLHVGASGTALRLLTGLCALGDGEVRIDGEEGLRRRPLAPLCDALRALGAEVEPSREGGAPVRVRGAGTRGGSVEVDGSRSSQFASSLLLIGPHLPRGLDLRVTGDLVSGPYLELTAAMLTEFGVPVERAGDRRYRVRRRRYPGRAYRVEGDASAASYFFAAAAVTGGRVRVTNLPRRSGRGDLVLLDILEELGCSVRRGSDWAEVEGGRLRGGEVDLSAAPDLAPTVAVVGIVAEGTTRVTGVPHLRAKESDRIEAVVSATRSLGGRGSERDDGFVIEGGSFGPGVVDPRDDHRIAMAFSILGLRQAGVRIRNPGCVAKSFPDFFERLAALGG